MKLETPPPATPATGNDDGDVSAARGFGRVSLTLNAVGLISLVVLAIGSLTLDSTARLAPLPWEGVREALSASSRWVAIGCLVLLLLPFARNLVLARCLATVHPRVRKQARWVMLLSSTVLLAAVVFSLR